MSKNNAVTIGADPEIFLADTRTGSVHPVCGLFGGTKGSPVAIEGITSPGFGLQEDNVMLEFNIPPAPSASEFVNSILKALAQIRDNLAKKFPHLELDERSSRLFPSALLTSPQAKVFGCSPDFDAYKDGDAFAKIKKADLKEDDGEWRFAGGHIHIGYKGGVPPFVAANFADLFLAIPTIRYDRQGKRREMYGQPGRFRPTRYGIEYRTLSNFWLWHPSVLNTIARTAFSLGNCLNGDPLRLQEIYQQVPWGDVQRAIKEEDVPLAARVAEYCHFKLGLRVLG